VIPPTAPGRYALGVDLVREHVHWFGDEQRIEVEVRSVSRIGILVDPLEASRAVGIARTLTASIPDAELTLLARDPESTRAATGYPAGLDPTVAALRDRPPQLLLAAARHTARRSALTTGRPLDVVVIAGISRLSGSGGRREALALAAVIRSLAQAGVAMVAVESTDPGTQDPVARLTTRALALVDERVEAGAEELLVAAVQEILRAGPSREAARGLP
jgi:hypothetical protein